MIHESCFWLWLFYNNICFRLHTRIAEEIYWNLNYLRESGKKFFNLFFVEAIKNFLNETKKIRICLALPFLSPEFDRPFPTDEFCKCFLLFSSVFFFFFAARAYQRKRSFRMDHIFCSWTAQMTLVLLCSANIHESQRTKYKEHP